MKAWPNWKDDLKLFGWALLVFGMPIPFMFIAALMASERR